MDPLRISELIGDLAHGGALDGATQLGDALDDGRIVRLALWLEDGRVTRARFKSTTCATLLAASEAACRLLEDGVEPQALDAAALGRVLVGLHPMHLDRLELVARAVRAAAPGHDRGAQA